MSTTVRISSSGGPPHSVEEAPGTTSTSSPLHDEEVPMICTTAMFTGRLRRFTRLRHHGQRPTTPPNPPSTAVAPHGLDARTA